MTTQVLHPLAAEYLDRLRVIAKRLPRARREELLADIEVHLSEAIAPEAGQADALTVLDRLGIPEEIVAAELPEPPADARGTREWAAVILLLFGGFIVGIGWIVGLILLWSSRCWNAREKWLGTLIVPGGWAGGLWVALAIGLASSGESCSGSSNGPTVCTGGPSTLHQILVGALLVVLVLGPPLTAIFLARRARTPPALRHLEQRR